MFDLTGRVIVVTGGAGGIGGACASALARQGATVILADLDLDGAQTRSQAIGAEGGKAVPRRLDVTVESEWAALMAEIRREFGRLDGLVNAAGILRPKPFEFATVQELDTTLDINVRSVFMGSHAASGLMIETSAKYGAKPSIVNLSSIYGAFAGVAHVVYSTSKGAVRMMSKGMAQELAKHQIRVNTVFPGPVNTKLMADSLSTLADYGLRAKGKEGLEAVGKMHPMGRMAEPEDIAGVVTFLCSDASSFMTGGELVVDGGLTLM
jgi:NAD(P)-dependent dehydrogenase (short-subunit alcohol dehydrogenase family)